MYGSRWMNGCMNEGMSEWVSEWMNGWLWLRYVISLDTSMLLGNEQGTTDFPLQQCLGESFKMLRLAYNACLK